MELHKSRQIRSFVVPLLAASLLADCGSDSTAPKTPAVASILLSESAVTLEEGLSKELVATLKTSTGSVLTGIPVTWRSDNPAVASVNAGVVVGVAMGSARITAAANGITATATVVIIAPLLASIKLSRYTAVLAPGRTFELTANALDSRGRVLSRPIAFTSSNTAVAEVTAAGLVTTKAVGAAAITASVEGKQSSLDLTVVLPTAVSFAVQSAAPPGFLQLSSFWVRVRHADDSVSANIPFGAPATLAGSMVLADVLEFAADGNDASTWPSSAQVSRTDMPSSIPIVFIPRNITLASGTYAGTTVYVSIAAATAPCTVVNSSQCANGFYGTSFSYGVKRWPSYPIPVAIDAGVDSARVWDALRAMEASTGRKMFVVADETHNSYISVKSGLPPGVSGFAGYTTWNWDIQNRMTSATVWLTTTSRGLTQHEFLHALGFWHTCQWTSVMGGYGCAQASEVSSSDVGYLLLASAVYEAETSLRLPNGQLPCGMMSLFAAIFNQPAVVSCSSDNLHSQDLLIRQESAP